MNADALRGRVALVTGGTGALGSAICRNLAARGACVVVAYRRAAETAQRLVADLGGPERAAALQVDLASPEAIAHLFAAADETFGRLDILINDAATNKWIPFPDLDGLRLEDWRAMMDVNLTAPFLCIKHAAPRLRAAGGGHIVNVASGAGLHPHGSSIGYAVAKAGLIHLTKCMAVALAPDILVNCVAPGFMTETRASSTLSADYREKVVSGALLKRPADKADVARIVGEFCATASITGQTLVVDSGRTFH